jgi:hypothetical protein
VSEEGETRQGPNAEMAQIGAQKFGLRQAHLQSTPSDDKHCVAQIHRWSLMGQDRNTCAVDDLLEYAADIVLFCMIRNKQQR